MKPTTLVIMAAGMGSRFEGGIKQLTPIGPNGEIIMEYSIRDAVAAGFTRVVFIIRRDLEELVRREIGDRMQSVCQIDYAFQEMSDIPEGYTVPEGRVKPWGTGQAVLACRDIVHEPFVIINADDYYGKEAFVKVHDFLMEHYEDEHQYCMAGFILKNTLSEYGGVSRGICTLDENGYLKKVTEEYRICKTEKGAIGSSNVVLDEDTYVSMNMWGATPDLMKELEKEFVHFMASVDPEDLKAEFLLPKCIDQMLKEDRITVAVLETKDRWYGITFKEDVEEVREAFRNL